MKKLSRNQFEKIVNSNNYDPEYSGKQRMYYLYPKDLIRQSKEHKDIAKKAILDAVLGRKRNFKFQFK